VASALEPLLSAGLAWVSPSANGWVSVYPESTERQDTREMEGLSAALSASLGAPVLGVLVHDSDVLRLWSYIDGRPIDEYDSDPDYFAKASRADRERLKGRPESIASLGPPGTSVEAIAAALAVAGEAAAADPAQLADMKQRLEAKLAELKRTQPKLARKFEGQVEAMLAKLEAPAAPVLAEARLAAVAQALGIGETRALAGYADVESGQADIADLVLVPEARAAKRRAQDTAEADRRAARRAAQREQGELLWAYEVPRRRGRNPVIRTLGFDPDGRFWLVEAPSQAGPQSLVVLDASGADFSRQPHEGLLWTTMSPDGALLAAITGPRRPIQVRRTSDLAVVAELPPTPRGLGAVHLSSTGDHVAVDDFDGSLSFYRLSSGALLRRIDIRGTEVRACGWSRDGRRFARLDGGDVISSDVAADRGDILVRLSRHGMRGYAATFLPESHGLLAVGDGGGGVFSPTGDLEQRLAWSLVGTERTEAFERMAHHLGARGSHATGEQLANSQPKLAQSGRAVAATSAWRAVLAADGIVRFWSAAGEALGSRATQQGLLWELFVSHDGARVVTGGNPVLCWRPPAS
jgi:hypothetical protein